MAGTRTNALVAAGASSFVMCAFLVRDGVRNETQIVSYVVSGVEFLGAGVIFKDAGSVRGLNTAATIWCSAAIGAMSGLGAISYAAILAVVVLLANIVLRPLAYKLHPAQQTTGDEEATYALELVCRAEDEARIRALLLQALAHTSLLLASLRSEDIEGTPKLKVSAQIRSLGRQDAPVEEIIGRLALEPGVTAASWTLSAQGYE
jgi:putative Mg2+ transporter-C (MgtC) family protein